jgi:hypothetical protein
MNAKIFFASLALVLSPIAGFAADIASVNFQAIKDDLREYYLAKPENAELKTKYEALVLHEKSRQEEMQKTLLEGKSPVNLASAMKSGMGAMDQFQLERKIDAGFRKELYLIVSALGLKYELIYDASDTTAIIYTKSQVDDLTVTVKQALIDKQKDR